MWARFRQGSEMGERCLAPNRGQHGVTPPRINKREGCPPVSPQTVLWCSAAPAPRLPHKRGARRGTELSWALGTARSPRFVRAPCAPRPHKSAVSNSFLVRRNASVLRIPLRRTEKREALMDVGILEVGVHSLLETLTTLLCKRKLKTSLKLMMNSNTG